MMWGEYVKKACKKVKAQLHKGNVSIGGSLKKSGVLKAINKIKITRK